MEINFEGVQHLSALLKTIMIYHVSIVLAIYVLNSRMVISLNATVYGLYRAGVSSKYVIT